MRKFLKAFLVIFLLLFASQSLTFAKTKKEKINILPQPFSFSPQYLSKTTGDIILEEGFENYSNGGWSTIDNDGDGKTWALYVEQPPGDTLAHTGIKAAGCEYNSSGNDDYFVTPQIALPSTGSAVFSFWAKSHSASYPEAFNVKISNSGREASDFTFTLQAIPSAPATWTLYQYDLGAFKGNTVYLALQCVSVDKWYLWADDFKCEVESGNIDIPEILSASYGPPANADTWEKFIIPMTAATFGVTDTEFNAAMQQISMIRIRTEMHDGGDYGAIDNVRLGSTFSSYFTSNTEEWSASGDGTMSWEPTGGFSGGYLKISDWASGDWHWAVAPASWTGNLSSLIGQNFEFYCMTNYPDYAAVVEFHTGDANRIVLSSGSVSLTPGATTQLKVALVPTPAANIVVNLSSSNTGVLNVPSSVTVGTVGYATVTVTAGTITEESSAVVTASTSGYTTSRITFTVTPGSSDDWTSQQSTQYDTPEADIVVRTGDIDNLNFGWPIGFDPFSGNNTPIHSFPWTVDPTDAEGTDRIMVVSSYNGNPPHGQDGYTNTTSRPDNYPQPVTLAYNLNGVIITSAALQIFVDDFQAPNFHANYQVTIDNIRIPVLESIINSLSQTGPIGKMISVSIPSQYLSLFNDGEFEILFDDPITGAGDGFAIDFVKLLINPRTYTYTGTITGKVTDEATGTAISGATVSASGIVTTTTNSNGDYTLSSVPAGINYVEVSKSGYATEGTNVDLQADETETVNFTLGTSDDLSTLKGQVTNALNGEPIEGAVVQVAGLSDITDSNGNYEIQNVPPGELTANFYGLPTTGNAPLTVNFYDNSASDAQTVTAGAEGFAGYSNSQVIITAGSTVTLDISLSPVLTSGKMRFVLNWDDDPRDVDSHLYTPEIEGFTRHIYWSNKGNESEAPFATLDHDDTDGYGPETTTIHDFFPGKYSYWIYKYTGNQELSQSNSVVQIYGENGLIRTLNVPSGGSERWWHVCDVEGATQTITIVNQLKEDVEVSTPNSVAEEKIEISSVLAKAANPVNSWYWTFGDGSSSSEQHPTHIYTNEGSYTVTLTISDGINSKTETKTNYIIVQNAIAGLIAHYPFSGNANDASGNGYHGEVFGPASSYDRYNNFNSAYYFDGVDDRIKLPHDVVNGLNDFTMIFWINTTQSSGDKYFFTAVDPSGYNELLFGIEGGRPASYVEDNSYSYNQQVADGAWHQIIYSRSGTTIKCHVDGVFIDEDTSIPSSTLTIPENALWLGGDQDAVGDGWDQTQQFGGYLDDIQIYNVMLNDGQIANIYNIGRVAIEDEFETVIPESYSLSQNYPNPFNPTTTIQYTLKNSVNVKLTVFDLNGKVIQELVNKHQIAGTYFVSWNAGNNPSGIYIVRLETSDFMTSRKMMFMK
ncbi:MAG: carboxypeptidase regulatory-like domain-containing protein [Candidatus Marinimicrobia bacterium]|nr:carboxypeptidase regulatory-like domain-containing protein [Candidatus Neomarinimicrobiota bacterium]